MTTIKSFTDVQQSKKLAEILPLESADMVYEGYKDELTNEINYTIGLVSDWKSSYPDRNIFEDWNDTFMPCWSLTALFGVLPKIGSEEPMIRKLYYASKPVERYICEYGLTNMTSEYDNPVDACYEMILKLNELKML